MGSKAVRQGRKQGKRAGRPKKKIHFPGGKRY